MLKKLMGSAAFSFAHLAGLQVVAQPAAAEEDLRGHHAAAAAAAEEADEDMEEEAEEEDDDADAAGKGGKKNAKKKSGDDGEEDEDEDAEPGEEDGDEDEDEEASEGEDGKGGKKAAKKPAKPAAAKPAKPAANEFKRGKKAERRRIGLILNHPAAAGNLQLAVRLACNSGMSSSAAISALEATPAARGGSLDRRMDSARVPEVTAATPKLEGAAAIDASWDHAMKPFVPSK